MQNRRCFLRQSVASGALLAGGTALPFGAGARNSGAVSPTELDETLGAILLKPVLKKEFFPNPVILESVEMLRHGNEYIIRARSKDGAEGYAVSNHGRMDNLWPFFVQQVAPFFKGKDARDLDQLVEGCLDFDSNYKYMSMAVLLPIASAEFAILDLLGQVSGKSVGELLGGVRRPVIDVYRANNFRGQSAEESVAQTLDRFRTEKPRAVKFKVGGRMGLPEVPADRTEKLIPLMRKTFGDDVILYADANGSYDVREAIRIGRMLEAYNVAFFEEPCPFDWLWETKQIGEALTIPIAGGEQESSMRRFRWMVANDALQIFQPDLFYFGGLIRSIKVARMAEAVSKPCTPHMSAWGLGSLYMLHFASVVANPGPFQEYKGVNQDIPLESTSTLEVKNGQVKVPTGPGFGVKIAPDWLAKAKLITHGKPS